MKQVTAYRCQYCSKVYLSRSFCLKHEEHTCPQNPEIRPLCYSCEHYEASFCEAAKERVEYHAGYNYDGSEYHPYKLFSPNRCAHSAHPYKLYNNLKLSSEMRAGLSDAGYLPMPTVKTGGCPDYKAIPNHPYTENKSRN